jgi:hypothetical protein
MFSEYLLHASLFVLGSSSRVRGMAFKANHQGLKTSLVTHYLGALGKVT